MPQRFRKTNRYTDRRIGGGVDLTLVSEHGNLQVFRIDTTGVHFQFNRNKEIYSLLINGEWAVVEPGAIAAGSPVPTAADEPKGDRRPRLGLPPSAIGGSIESRELSVKGALADAYELFKIRAPGRSTL